MEILERIYFDSTNRATQWLKSFDHGKTWEEVDCSIYPDGRPPFVRCSNWERYVQREVEN